LGAALRYLVGVKRLMLRVCAPLPAGIGQIHSIVVHPDFRRLGFARRLVGYLEDELFRAGVRSIMLYVLEGNDVVGMYAKLGYRRVPGGGRLFDLVKHPGFLMYKEKVMKGEGYSHAERTNHQASR